MQINTGIAAEDRAAIAESLSRLLADTYTLYLKTHGFHWNVTGPMFRSLHLMFEEEYIELGAAVDQIAEILGSSVGAVKANFFHALANLKKLLTDER